MESKVLFVVTAVVILAALAYGQSEIWKFIMIVHSKLVIKFILGIKPQKSFKKMIIVSERKFGKRFL